MSIIEGILEIAATSQVPQLEVPLQSPFDYLVSHVEMYVSKKAFHWHPWSTNGNFLIQNDEESIHPQQNLSSQRTCRVNEGRRESPRGRINKINPEGSVSVAFPWRQVFVFNKCDLRACPAGPCHHNGIYSIVDKHSPTSTSTLDSTSRVDHRRGRDTHHRALRAVASLHLS